MPNLKDSINIVYKEHHLSEEIKNEVLRKINKRTQKRQWMPYAVAFAMMIVLLIFVASWNVKDPAVHVSSKIAPNDADEQIMKRIQSFYEIISDEIITEEERANYLMTSDWAVQLALDHGESPFYNRPNITSAEAKNINLMLNQLYSIVKLYEQFSLSENFPIPSTFSELAQKSEKYTNELKQYSDAEYQSSIKERPIFNKDFFMLTLKWQIVICALIVLFVYLFIKNIQEDKKVSFFIFHVISLILLFLPFVHENVESFAYDEASILEAVEEGGELLAIAQFDDVRLALVNKEETELQLMVFEKKEGKRYRLNYSIIDYNDEFHYISCQNHSKLPNGEFYAVGNRSEISQFYFIDNETYEKFRYEVDPENAQIYHFSQPSSFDNLTMEIIKKNNED